MPNQPTNHFPVPRSELRAPRSKLSPPAPSSELRAPSCASPAPSSPLQAPSSDVLVRVDGVSKKFCKSLKRSLWYGVKDTVGEMFGQTGGCELRHNEFWAVKDVSFELKRGECLGLIGHNGAGKSTLLKMLNGLIKPDTGRIEMHGRIGALIELGAGFNPILTGRENIYNSGAVLGFPKAVIDQRFDAIVDFAEIADFLDTPVQNYSSGMKVRLGFAVAAQMDPDVLIIDEVLAVGDAAFRHKCLGRIATLRERTACIFVSHSMPQIYRISSTLVVMHHGQIIFQGAELGQGVQRYFSLFNLGKRHLLGAETIDIQNFKMNSGTGSTTDDTPLPVNYGADLHISFTLTVKADILRVGVKISFWNEELLPVLDLVNEATTSNFLLDYSDCRTKDVEVWAKGLTLNSGHYTITVVVADKMFQKIYARAENIGRLAVQAPYPTGAHHIVGAKWDSSGCRQSIPQTLAGDQQHGKI